MAEKRVDVAIIGAGTAGLKATREVAAATDNFVVIDPGPLGTLCARAGCMPSKALLQVAADYHRRCMFEAEGISGGDGLSLDGAAALAHVRRLRDGFVESVLSGTIADCSDKMVKAEARFLEPQVLQAGDARIRAGSVIIAAGSRPMIPPPWRRFAARILTTDTVFNQERLPGRLAVLGLGPVGLEMGQALARMGVTTTGFDADSVLGGLSDPVVGAAAADAIGRELPLHLGVEAEVEDDGDDLRVRAGETSVTVDALLVAVGRRPDIDALNLAALGVALDDHGLPPFDRETMQVAGLPVFIAGDVDADRPLLHEAGHEGMIAGFNAVQGTPVAFRRKSALAITFTDPNLCSVGVPWPKVAADDPAVAEGRVNGGRFRIMGEEIGMVRLYAARDSGRLLGAAIALPDGEHLAHLLAWAHQAELGVHALARMPFYHPSVEEVLQGPLSRLCAQIEAPAGTQAALTFRPTLAWPPPRLRF